MIIQTPNPLSLMDALPDFRRTSHIFLPINDCRAPNLPEGGSHWSLLLVSIIDGVAFHYDSLAPANEQSATIACDKLSTILGKQLKFVNLEDSPQQANGSDCGVFVCLEMKHLLMKRLLQRDSRDQVSMTMRGREIDASKGRREMLKLIEEFRREGKRSPSRGGSPFHRNSASGSPPRVGD